MIFNSEQEYVKCFDWDLFEEKKIDKECNRRFMLHRLQSNYVCAHAEASAHSFAYNLSITSLELWDNYPVFHVNFDTN